MATATCPPTQIQVTRPRAALTAGEPARLESVDLVRGGVMVLMVLDHVREFFTNAQFGPVDPARTSPGLFLTRWVTHFCAPAFVFLAGTGVYLAATRGKSRPELSRFLLTRGFWLIFLEVTVVRLGMTFNLDYRFVPAGVLWAIGWSMIALAGLIWLPRPLVLGFGLTPIAGHNLLDTIESESFGRLGWLWKVLHQQGGIKLLRGHTLRILYPLIPWIGVMAAGYASGVIFTLERVHRRRLLVITGLSLMGAFVVLRGLNVYGNPSVWTVQKSPLLTVFSFLACKKYPPSLLFLLMTLGPLIFSLGLLDRAWGPLGQPLILLGRIPLFFYLLQWPLVHALAVVLFVATGQPYGWLFASRPFKNPPGSGFDLPVIYGIWVITILLLYPACRWFAALKRRRKDAWLRYL
jgi:uncharacterized membrane protein